MGELSNRYERAWAAAATRDAPLEDFYNEACVMFDPFCEAWVGRDRVRDLWDMWAVAVPDFHAERVHCESDDGNYLTTILAITGTFTGPLKGPKGMIAPTGKRFEITVVDVHEFDDQGRFLFTRAFMDVHSFMRQLGVDPSEYLDAYDPEVYVREARAKQAEIWRAGSLPGR